MADHRLQIVLAAKDVTGTAFTKLQGRISALTKSVFSLKGGLVAMAGAYGMKLAATAALDVASSFEMMQVKLDALTKGKGQETLDKINAWALEMPVNTRKAVDTFAMMQAMGLDPTIEKMQTLVDTASIFGQDTMPRVARALGQMATLGKLSAEELNQMSEAGINARKYLTEAFGMTVEELQKSQVSIEEIIDAIWQGLDADFGGAAIKAQDSWQGMVATFKSYMEEIAKQVMDAGIFEMMKENLKAINDGLKLWIAQNAELIKQEVPKYLNQITAGMQSIAKAAEYVRESWKMAMMFLDTTGTTGIGGLIQLYKLINAPKDNRSAGALDFDAQEASLAGYKNTVTQTVTETNNLAGATNKVKEAIGGVTRATREQIQWSEDMYNTMVAESEISFFAMNEHVSAWGKNYKKVTKDATDESAKAFDSASSTLESGLGNALTDIVTKAKTAKEAFANFAKSTLNWMIKLVLQQATSSLFSGFSVSTNAQGNVYDQSGMIPFARGGIVNRPTIFPFASGTGLMGESGPEAILPLTRTSGGDLGVKTDGEAAGGTTIIINANDAKSFDDMIRRGSASVIRLVNDALIGNTSLRSTMRRTL